MLKSESRNGEDGVEADRTNGRHYVYTYNVHEAAAQQNVMR